LPFTVLVNIFHRIPGCKQFEKHAQVFIVIDNCDFKEFWVSRQNQAASRSDLPIAEKEGLENSALANSEAKAKAVASNKMTRMTRRITDPSVSITETEISDAVEI